MRCKHEKEEKMCKACVYEKAQKSMTDDSIYISPPTDCQPFRNIDEPLCDYSSSSDNSSCSDSSFDSSSCTDSSSSSSDYSIW